MVKTDGAPDWRSARRQSAREAILESAWAAVREEGLAALSLRDLARRCGITTPTVYAYFDSKSDIYDAMFGQAAKEFLRHMSAPPTPPTLANFWSDHCTASSSSAPPTSPATSCCSSAPSPL